MQNTRDTQTYTHAHTGGAVPASPARVPHQGMHSVHSFPTLMAAQSPSKGGLGGARGGFVEDGGQDHR